MAEIPHTPPWADPPSPDDKLAAREAVDVCVIGAGIAGLSVAYQLAKAGKQVLVLDAGSVASGQTHNTSAHLSSVIDDRFSSVEAVRGREAARLAHESHAAGLDAVERACRDEGIDCNFQRLDGFLVLSPDRSEGFLREEFEAARRAGTGVEWVAGLDRDGAAFGPALRFHNQARFEPVRYLAGLCEAIRERGGRIVTGERAASFEDGTPAKVTTGGGSLVEAGAVVVATNSPVNDRVRLQTKLYPYITYMVGLEVPKSASADVLIWDTADPYHYVRRVIGDGDTDELIVGGEDHKTGQADDQKQRFGRLANWAYTTFPSAERMTRHWSGQVLETLDGLAYIGRNPGDDGIYVVTGDSGMGLTHGSLAGLLLTDLILGRPNPWEDLYDPSRTPIISAGTFISEGMNVAGQYLDWLTSGDVSSADDIPPGGGALVRDGLRKLAVHRDESGRLHACSAVCPHLGAIVQWNDAEETWDCPAHGSRFKATGEVIQGPANEDLTGESEI